MADGSKITAFLEDQSSHGVVVEVAKQMGIAEPLIINGGLKEAVAHFKAHSSPEFLLVDSSGSTDVLADLKALAEVCEHHTKPIIIGHHDSVEAYRRLKAQGVEDYLVKPISTEQLMEAVGVLNRSAANNRFILVMGGGRGTGASSIAANLGWGLGVMNRRFTCLLDLDLVGSDLGLLLKKAPSGDGILSLLERGEAMDEVAIERITEKVEQRLFLVAGKGDLLEKHNPNYPAFGMALRVLKDRFPYVIAEGDYCSPLAAHSLAAIDTMVLVATPQAASLLKAKEIVDKVRSQNQQMRVITVLNKVGMYLEGEISIQKTEEYLGEPVALQIPFDKEYPLTEMNAGVMLIDSKGPVANSLKALVNAVSVEGSGLPIAIAKPTLLQRVMNPVIEFFK